MKKQALVLVVAALALTACSKNDSEPKHSAKPAAAEKVNKGPAKPVMPPGSPPPAPELQFDASGKPIQPPVVAPAPPKPAGGPQAPGLSPEAIKAAQAAIQKKQSEQQRAAAESKR